MASRDEGPSMGGRGKCAPIGADAPLEVWINCGRLELVVQTAILRAPDLVLTLKALPEPGRISVWLRTLHPAVLLLDAAVPGDSLLAWLAALRSQTTDLPVVILYEPPQPLSVRDILRLGITGCLPLHAPPAAYLKTIHAVSSGEMWLPRRVLSQALAISMDQAATNTGTVPETSTPAAGYALLTPRERSVEDLVSRGLSNKEVARQLRISEDTVKKHLKNVFGKLGVHRRAHLRTTVVAPAGRP